VNSRNNIASSDERGNDTAALSFSACRKKHGRSRRREIAPTIRGPKQPSANQRFAPTRRAANHRRRARSAEESRVTLESTHRAIVVKFLEGEGGNQLNNCPNIQTNRKTDLRRVGKQGGGEAKTNFAFEDWPCIDVSRIVGCCW